AAEFAPLTGVAIDARRAPFAGQGAAYMAWRRSLAAAARDHVKRPRAGGQTPAQAAQAARAPSTMQPAPKAAKDGATQ
ncbi:MAG: hypothetical protein RQ752_16510, partial [Thermohalobaculum sp.]|nr:hypothetical protein [Thermohalobaculum sp.]